MYVTEKKVFSIPKDLPKEMTRNKAGVFVSIHQKNGELRGCIGTFFPTCKNVTAEIIQNAISSATKDPRFAPITEGELPNLEIQVDVLSDPQETIEKELNPKKYGLIVENDLGASGLLLPDIPGVNTVAEQINICKQKAFISENEPVKLFRFTVERHKE